MSDESVATQPVPMRQFKRHGIEFFVYATPEEMGAASAIRLADEQIRLADRQQRIGFLLMAAPSAYPFYAAYLDLAQRSQALRAALSRTHFFQFDDYPLPATHPASFRFLLTERFFTSLHRVCPAVTFHPLNVDEPDSLRVCREYAARVLEFGPHLQLKGVGENGHWGFHEPGIPLDGEPAYIRVETSDANTAQQMRDHPTLFTRPSDVPRVAYTANVPLFLRTREAIEDNVPQESKAFALLAAYGSDKVDAAVPTSALKRHHNATVRMTANASWALEKYARDGRIDSADVARLVQSLGGPGILPEQETAATSGYVRRTLHTMEIRTTN